MSFRARLIELAGLVGGRVVGNEEGVVGVCIDSRQVTPGVLFVALRGEHTDGHEFVAAAHAAGAGAALVEHEIPGAGPQLVVDDAVAALGAIAHWWRMRHNLLVIAVTGSAGKTTVKDLLAAILGQRGAVLATTGNLNNQLGLPLTLLGLGEHHWCAVVEMGANHADEIAVLTEIARPDIGVVTNAGPAHLEGFGSVVGVARAKGELFTGLDDDGFAVINADDDHAALWRDLAGERGILQFGFAAGAEVTVVGESIAAGEGQRFTLRLPDGEVGVEMPLVGRHNVANVMAAAAAATLAGCDGAEIAAGLAGVHAEAGRMQEFRGPGGCRIIDDTYNANPVAFDAAFDLLAEYPGRRWIAIGDMAELGFEARRWHAWVGEQARLHGIERLYAVGELATEAVRAFGDGGVVCDDQRSMVEALRGGLEADVSLLVKGSRAARMEQVVAALTRDAEEGG